MKEVQGRTQIQSNNPDDYIFENLESENEPLPGTAIGTTKSDRNEASVLIGKSVKTIPENKTETITDPFGGQEKSVKASIKSRNVRKGETVYRVIMTLDN